MDISNTIQDLITESQRTKKSRVQDVTTLVNTISEHAYQHGLESEDLASIIDLVREPSTLDQTSITTLIKSLYPAQRIPSSLVSTIVAALGPSEKKPSAPTQSLLLWWLVAVRTAFAEWNVLERLYSILFNLLDMLTIRTNVCRILCLITRRKHVKPWRIYRLHELSQSASNDTGLNALLKVYQTFFPDVIVPQGKSMEIFKDFDKEWIGRLNAIQEQNDAARVDTSAFEVVGQGNKRRKTGVVPRLQTRRMHENTVPLEELQTIEDMGNKYERIEYPNQIVSALDNRLLRRLVMLRDDEVLHKRLNDWLRLFFDSHIQSDGHEEGDKILSEVLDQLVIFCRQTMTVPGAFLEFLHRYLQRWQGKADRAAILNILSCLDITDFRELRLQILEPLEQALVDGTESSNLDALGFYTKMLQSWTARLVNHHSVYSATIPNVSETILALISHCSTLVLQILSSNPSPYAQATLQEYLQSLAYQFSLKQGQSQVWTSLVPLEAYLTIFTSPTIFSLSSFCLVLSAYRDALKAYMSKQAGSKSTSRRYRETVVEFNGYILDVCNLLWRGRAFSKTENNAFGCLLPEETANSLQKYIEGISVDGRYAIPHLFSLSFHPALAAFSIQSLRNMEDRVIADHSDEEDVITQRHAGPATQRSLAQLGVQGGIEVTWLSYRKEILEDLTAMGADGIEVLIQGTMTA